MKSRAGLGKIDVCFSFMDSLFTPRITPPSRKTANPPPNVPIHLFPCLSQNVAWFQNL
ncbi:MAG: hypothetical protein ABFD00_01410 [Chloroherpetonaceae bacterium]